VSHTATDKTVSAARAAAKPTAGADVERLVTVLRPVLGQPVRRALVDGCMLNNPDNYVSNDIACRRSYYLYYPTAEPPLAAVISGVLADDAHTTAYDSPTQSGWATTSGVGYRSGEVWIVSKPATASTYITVGPESPLRPSSMRKAVQNSTTTRRPGPTSSSSTPSATSTAKAVA